MAESFGWRNEIGESGRIVARASEMLMKRFYWAAKAVSQLNQILLLNLEERIIGSGLEPQPINERFFNKAKQFRRIATRYDKLAENYLAALKLVAVRIWLRDNESTS